MQNEQLVELLSMLKGFDIVHIGLENDCLTLGTSVCWSKSIEECPDQIGFGFWPCQEVSCKYLKLLKDQMVNDSVTTCPLETVITTNLEEVSGLNLNIHHLTIAEPNIFTLVCNGLPYTGGGWLTFNASEFQAFTYEDRLISFDEMKIWYQQYRTLLTQDIGHAG